MDYAGEHGVSLHYGVEELEASSLIPRIGVVFYQKFVDGRFAQIAVAVDLDAAQRAFEFQER
jgi:hypothetical protein